MYFFPADVFLSTSQFYSFSEDTLALVSPGNNAVKRKTDQWTGASPHNYGISSQLEFLPVLNRYFFLGPGSSNHKALLLNFLLQEHLLLSTGVLVLRPVFLPA